MSYPTPSNPNGCCPPPSSAGLTICQLMAAGRLSVNHFGGDYGSYMLAKMLCEGVAVLQPLQTMSAYQLITADTLIVSLYTLLSISITHISGSVNLTVGSNPAQAMVEGLTVRYAAEDGAILGDAFEIDASAGQAAVAFTYRGS